MYLTRKIEICIYGKEPEIKDAFRKQLSGWRNIARSTANEVLSYLYSIDRLRNTKLSEERDIDDFCTPDKKSDFIKGSYSVANNFFVERMRGRIPADISNCLFKSVTKRYLASRYDIIKGKITLPIYRNTIPLPFSSVSLKNLHWDESDKGFIFNLFGITLVINLGRDRSNNKKLIESCMRKEIELFESSIIIDDYSNKIFLLMTYSGTPKEYRLDDDRAMDVSLSVDNPIIVKFNGEIKKIGNKEEFLHRRLQIQAARRRAQINSRYLSGGKGRRRKLYSVYKFRNKEKDYILTRVHTYTKMVVDYAVKNRCKTIILMNQEEQEQYVKNEPFLLRNWNYFGIKHKLEYKAKLNGINIVIKKVILMLAFVILSGALYGQRIDICRNAVQTVISGINSHTSEQVINLLSKEFSISGYKGDIAKKVVDILIRQLNETVLTAKETGCDQIKEGLKLTYDFEYKTLGSKEAFFVFDSLNQILGLSLLDIKVKTMGNTEIVKDTAQKIRTIPFKLAGRLITVDVLINDTTRTFLLDSGSPRIVLNSKYFPSENPESKRLSEAKGVGGNIPGMDLYHLRKFCWAGDVIYDQDFITVDLTHLEKSRGIVIYGMIGYELLKDYDIVFDYQNKKLTLVSPEMYDMFKSSNLKGMNFISVPFELRKHIPVVKISVLGKHFRFGVDCGAEANLFLQDYFNELKEGDALNGLEELTLRGMDNSENKTKVAPIRKITIGDKEFGDLQFVFADISHLNKGQEQQLDGLLGYEVLSKQITVLSYKRRELIFTGNFPDDYGNN
ncbi:MAG: aspartyl protease family protein [Bacteroidales bacterium]|nr:aspartyl protease family protein [Bacteroidales bacterium]